MKRTIATAIIAMAMTGSAFAETNVCFKLHDLHEGLQKIIEKVEFCRDSVIKSNGKDKSSSCKDAEIMMDASNREFNYLKSEIVLASYDRTRDAENVCAKDMLANVNASLNVIQFNYDIMNAIVKNNGEVK